MKKLLSVLCLLVLSVTLYGEAYKKVTIKMRDITVYCDVPSSYKKFVEKDDIAVLSVNEKKTVPYASITFNYATYEDIINERRPMGLGKLRLSSNYLLDMIEKNPAITRDDIVKELRKSDSAIWKKGANIYYYANSGYGYTKFTSGLEGFECFSISCEEKVLDKVMFLDYFLVLDKGILNISFLVNDIDGKTFVTAMKAYGEIVEQSGRECLRYEGQAQVDKIYSDIKNNKSKIPNLHTIYQLYDSMKKTLSVSYEKK